MTTETIEKLAKEKAIEAIMEFAAGFDPKTGFESNPELVMFYTGYFRGYAALLAEKDKEIEGWEEQSQVADKIAEILGIENNQLQKDLAAKDLELQNLKAVGGRLAGLLKEYVDMGKVSRTSLLYQEATETLSDWQRLKEKK